MNDHESQSTARPIYCPRRQQHAAVCETPDGCAGGADCRLGPDVNLLMNDWPTKSKTTLCQTCLGSGWVSRSHGDDTLKPSQNFDDVIKDGDLPNATECPTCRPWAFTSDGKWIQV